MDKNYRLLAEFGKRLSYKPDHAISIRRVDDDTAILSLRCPSLPDAYKEGETVGLTINHTVHLAAVITQSDALREYANLIAAFEVHEAAEWLKLDRRSVFRAHAWGDEFGGFNWSHFLGLTEEYLRPR